MVNLQQTSRVYGNGEIKSIRKKMAWWHVLKTTRKRNCGLGVNVYLHFLFQLDSRDVSISHSFSQPLMTVCRSASRWPGIFSGFLSLVFYLSFPRAEASWLLLVTCNRNWAAPSPYNHNHWLPSVRPSTLKMTLKASISSRWSLTWRPNTPGHDLYRQRNS